MDTVRFRIDTDLLRSLTDRAGDGSANETARRDLSRYYELLSTALASVELTPGEAGLIVDCLNGTFIDVFAVQLLHASIEDSVEELAEKWQVDGAALVQKARGWNLLQKAAIVDAAEQFWSLTRIAQTQDRLIRVGLVRRV